MARSRLTCMLVTAALLGASCTGGGSVASQGGPPPPSSSEGPPGGTPPDISVRGGRFVASDGSPVLLRGVDVHSLDPRVYRQAPGLGVNFVRLAVAWSDFQPRAPQNGDPGWDTEQLQQLDSEIGFFGQHDIAVLIDLHQYGWSPYFASLQRGGRANGIPRWVYQGRRFPLTESGRASAQAAMYTDRRATQLYSAFASMLASRYRTTPNVVGYEILNEPPLGTMPRLAWAVQRIIRWQSRVGGAIRAVDPYRAVVFMVPPRSDLHGVQLGSLERLGHLAMDVHDYYAGTGAGSRTTLQGGPYRGTLAEQRRYLAPYAAQARAWGVPLMIGEWGAFPTEPGVDEYQRQMVTLFEEQKLSWARWSLDRTERLGVLRGDGRMTAAGVQLGKLIRSHLQPQS